MRNTCRIGSQGHTCQISYQLRSLKKKKSMMKNRPKRQRPCQISINWFWEILFFAKHPSFLIILAPLEIIITAKTYIIIMLPRLWLWSQIRQGYIPHVNNYLDVNNWFEFRVTTKKGRKYLFLSLYLCPFYLKRDLYLCLLPDYRVHLLAGGDTAELRLTPADHLPCHLPGCQTKTVNFFNPTSIASSCSLDKPNNPEV